nr:hypothetical protein [Tanacetum cinerariifolium]
MDYHDEYKKVFNEIWKDKVELDGKIEKGIEEAIKRIKGEALKEKDDPRAFIFPIRLEGKVNENALSDIGSDINTMPYRIFETLEREGMKKVDRGIMMINHTQAEAMGMLTNILCQVGVTTIIAKFLIMDLPIDRDASIVVGQGFLYTIDYGGNDDEAGSSRSKCPRRFETVEEVLLPQVHHEFLLYEGCSWDAKYRALPRVLFDYEFDKVCADDELQTKKIIKFRLGGRAHSLTLLEFAQRLGLYQAVKLDEEGFNVYFERGLHSDEHFNAQEYSLRISREDNLDLDTTTLRDLIDSVGRLIPDDPQLGVPRVGVLRPQRASMHDLYDRMGRMEICQEGAYKPPSYVQSQYDQYYQQCPPPPPSQQQHDDDE